jgi:hypothetical protein
MTMLLTVPNYDDWRWAGTGVNPPGAPVAAVLTEITTDEWAWVFANNATMVFPDQQIPHDYAEGTDIQPHIHWTPTTTATYTGTWTMVITNWVSAATGTAKSGPTTLTAAFTGAVTAGQMQTQDFNTVLTGLNRKISSMATITLKLALSAGAGCALRGFDGHYQVNTLGSRLITVK